MNSDESMQSHFDWVADNDAAPRRRQRAFHHGMQKWHRQRVPAGSRVLEWGCGAGALLAELHPEVGVGLDFSPRMIERAQSMGARGCDFRIADARYDRVEGEFDYIILNYLAGYLPDIQSVLTGIQDNAHARTRLILTSLNNLWLWPLLMAQKIGWVTPQPTSNWLSTSDLVNLLELSGWEVVQKGTAQMIPFEIPFLTPVFNRFLVNFPGLSWMGITLTLEARPRRAFPITDRSAPACSVVVPLRNEAGNIRAALERIPQLGHQTEVIFVEGNSVDDTWEVLQREVAAYRGPHLVRILQQPGIGKWDAVHAGFAVATGTILVIQDGDLTAPPEDIPKFYDAIVSGHAEFANGSRLVYPMEKRAMRFLNFIGNKFFALSLSYVLGQPIKDSLCGTKMVSQADYQRILKRIEEFGDFDPFGDFNLLFGAALLNLRIRDIPVRYKDRTYGETNISRFKHGWLLLRMTWFGLRNIRWR